MRYRATNLPSAGYQHLIDTFDLTVKPLDTPCLLSRTAESITNDRDGAVYPANKLTGSSLAAHLGFALSEEGVNLEVLSALFETIPEQAGAEILRWNMNCPHGSQARRAAYLFEWLTERRIPTDGFKEGGHIDLVDPSQFLVSREPVRCDRFRVNNNLLGTPDYCPTVRRTNKTEAMAHMDTSGVEQVLREKDEEEKESLLQSEVSFSFLLEGAFGMMMEESGYLADRLANLGKRGETAETELTATRLAKLANVVSERPEARPTLRDRQNWIQRRYFWSDEPEVTYIPPSPEDLPTLFRYWVQWTKRQLGGRTMPPLILAVIGSFGFNFLHPFLDGNGRVHRYLFQALLVWTRAIPVGTIAPISPGLHETKWQYSNALEDFSDRIMLALNHAPNSTAGEPKVSSTHPRGIYQYWDATAAVELMHDIWTKAVQAIQEPHDEQGDAY